MAKQSNSGEFLLVGEAVDGTRVTQKSAAVHLGLFCVEIFVFLKILSSLHLETGKQPDF